MTTLLKAIYRSTAIPIKKKKKKTHYIFNRTRTKSPKICMKKHKIPKIANAMELQESYSLTSDYIPKP